MSDSTIKIYVANLAQYNNGNIIGDWFELPVSFSDISKKCQLSASEEEWIILDYEAPFKIHEYVDINQLNEIADQLEEVATENLNYLGELLDMGVFSDFVDAVERIDQVNVTEYTTWSSFAEDYIAESGDLVGVSELIQFHIDYEGIGRELAMESEFIQMSDGVIVDILGI